MNVDSSVPILIGKNGPYRNLWCTRSSVSVFGVLDYSMDVGVRYVLATGPDPHLGFGIHPFQILNTNNEVMNVYSREELVKRSSRHSCISW